MQSKDRPILITGATGFIGSYIIRYLLSKGYNQVHAIHRDTSQFDMIESSVFDQVTWHECDLTNYVLLEEIVRKVDVIINCAAVISFWPREYEMMTRINEHAVKRLVSIAEKHSIKKFIHLSSVEALGHEDNSISELSLYDERNALSMYSISKRRADEAIKSSSLDYTIYYPGFVLGGGYWDKAPLTFIKKIYEGMRFYPSGSIGLVDVRDIARVLIEHIDDERVSREDFILVSHNERHEIYFKMIADHLKLSKGFKPLKEPFVTVAIFFESIKALFTKVAPLITRETYRISQHDLVYDNQQLVATTSISLRPLSKSIEDMCDCFTASYPSQNYGILDFD